VLLDSLKRVPKVLARERSARFTSFRTRIHVQIALRAPVRAGKLNLSLGITADFLAGNASS
jgi:hypothetical protein